MAPLRSDLAQRTLTAVVGLPILVGAAWAGGVWWTALLLAVGGFGLREWVGLVRARGQRADAGKLSPGAWAGAVGLGALWIILSLSHLFWLRAAPGGLAWLAFTAVCTWTSDAAAFFAGRRLGGPPLAPRLSPRKTVSGSLAGLGAAAAVGAWAFARWVGGNPLVGAALGFVLAAAGQAGDLLESAGKRWAGVKDSGTLLPGHGGILDRFDSLMLAGPTAYYLHRFFQA